jgi:CGNR zinc finger protein
MKAENKNTEYIKMFIEFANTDLKNLSSFEKMRWAWDLQEKLFYPSFYIKSFFRDINEVSDDDWKKILSIQEKAIRLLNRILDNKDQEIVLHYEAPTTFAWGGKDSEGRFYHRPTAIRRMYHEELTLSVHKGDSFTGDGALKIIPGFVNLLEALKGFPTSSLLVCPHCKKIFFNPTKRKKRYCSSRCQNNAAVNRIRKKKGD